MAVTGLEIATREAVLSGRVFRAAGPYEKVAAPIPGRPDDPSA